MLFLSYVTERISTLGSVEGAWPRLPHRAAAHGLALFIWCVATRVASIMLCEPLTVPLAPIGCMNLADQKREMPEAYERLILEVLRGDPTNFVSAAELEAAWRIFTPALHSLAQANRRPEAYKVGSRGPPSADMLARRIGLVKFGSQRDERRVSMGPLGAMHHDSTSEGLRSTDDGLDHLCDFASER